MKISKVVSRYTPDVPSSKEISKIVTTGVKVFDQVVNKVSNSGSGVTKGKTGGIGRAILDKGQSLFPQRAVTPALVQRNLPKRFAMFHTTLSVRVAIFLPLLIATPVAFGMQLVDFSIRTREQLLLRLLSLAAWIRCSLDLLCLLFPL